MNFKEAYKLMKDGKKVRRKGWVGYWFIEDEKVKIHLKDGNIKFNNFTQETIANTLAEDWEVVKEGKKYWEPKEDETYYIVGAEGTPKLRNFHKTNIISIYNIELGNCFKTKEEAKHMAEKLRVIHELQKFAYENNKEEIDWNTSQKKYMLIYDKGICVCWTVLKQIPLDIYFTSPSVAWEAVKTIGQERIEKYYFDIKLDKKVTIE